MTLINPIENFNKTKAEIGYVKRKQASQSDYDRIGFMSGLEVHQQLKTVEKLFCHCPAALYNDSDDYDAEIVRHMRPTLSELGEYDGTALMEFKTRKEIVYRIKNDSSCTYEIDDTPPFQVNKDAVELAIKIALLSKLNIVGEIHITRKQYLDGSIPTGFQRTAIIGVEGEIYLKNKKVRLIQLSLEEDSCREISDIGHTRIYKTDRLGMPLIETVTYPDMTNPDEVMEACDYIRYLNRSTGLVRTGIGAGREDVNVSCVGGTRVEIKGVAHTKWIPELTHRECFRQYALLNIREKLNKRVNNVKEWKIKYIEINSEEYNLEYDLFKIAKAENKKIYAVNLNNFSGILSHFTQENKMFANEISERLKVIACIEKPHMIHSEESESSIESSVWQKLKSKLNADDNDAQIIFWGPEADIKTALETIEERCKLAFIGVPPETRKSFVDGSTIFERVLPGADRMYPDTDSAPIPILSNYIEELRKTIPNDIIERYNKLVKWNIPEDTYKYIFSKNHFPLIENIIQILEYQPTFVGSLFGHTIKFLDGQYKSKLDFNYNIIYDLLLFLKDKNIEKTIIKDMLHVLYQHPKMDFDSILTTLNYKKTDIHKIEERIVYLREKFLKIRIKNTDEVKINWVMGHVRKLATGNANLAQLSQKI